MTNELDVFHCLWKDIVSGTMDSRFIDDQVWSRHFYDKEVAAIKKKITLRAYFYQTRERGLSAYIRFVVKKLVDFGNEIIASGTSCKSLSEAVDELLTFLISEYPQHFDYQLTATASYKAAIIEAQKENVDLIIRFLLTDTIEPELVLLIKEYVEENSHTLETFGDLSYYTQFCAALIKWFTHEPAHELQSKLILGLIQLNFNTADFIVFLKNKINQDYTDLTSYEIGLHRCAINLRKVKNIEHQSVWSFDVDRTHVKSVVVNLLRNEFEHILNLTRCKKVMVDEQTHATDDYMLVNLTVEQLAGLFRMFEETNIIIVAHKGDFYKFIAKHFRTKNTSGALSSGSVKNKWNEVTNQTIKYLKDMQIKLLNHINQNY